MSFLPTSEERADSAESNVEYLNHRLEMAVEKVAALRGLLREALPHIYDPDEDIEPELELLFIRMREEAFSEPGLFEF